MLQFELPIDPKKVYFDDETIYKLVGSETTSDEAIEIGKECGKIVFAHSDEETARQARRYLTGSIDSEIQNQGGGHPEILFDTGYWETLQAINEGTVL